MRLVLKAVLSPETFVRVEVSQVPSNIVMIRLGPRVWLPIIIVAWGVVATLFAGLKSATDFYVLRLLLGVAESGSFPGTVSHLLFPSLPSAALSGFLRHAQPEAVQQQCFKCNAMTNAGVCGSEGAAKCRHVVLPVPVLLRQGPWHGLLLGQRGHSVLTGETIPGARM